ncbi:MAG TPA: glycoside hydrolase family 66 protein [Anaerolineae bacterium]|nr:glycoside hydrolase family 66 protein [Anaerolineae bacterium]
MLKILDAYPERATYAPGNEASICIEILNESPRIFSGSILAHLVSLDREITSAERDVHLKPRARAPFALSLQLPTDDLRGYGVEIHVIDRRKQLLARTTTALDVCSDWTLAPRYGFLSDFAPDERDTAARLAALSRYHINALQFYDWMYRHDTLIPPTLVFQDALGRTLSLETIQVKLRLAQEYGMRTLAYTAIYAASPNFWRAHRAWGLFDAQGKPYMLGDFLNIMNLANSAWATHFQRECQRAIELGFDGIHLDQYGYPRLGYDSEGARVNVERALTPFLDGVQEAIGKRPTVFNAVNGWGLEAAAQSQVAPLYIEVWSPNDTYRDVREIILHARRLRNGRSPVLAAYINAFLSPDDKVRRGAGNALRLLTAAIYLNGGSQIVLGEKNGVLCDPYFPKYAHLTPATARALRADYDFISRYAEYFFDPAWRDVSTTRVGGINEEIRLDVPRYGPFAEEDSLWTIVRERKEEMTLGLVNLCGIRARWNEAKPKPRALDELKVTLRAPRRIGHAYYLTPGQSGRAARLPLKQSNGAARLTIPRLDMWGLLLLQF